MAMKRKPYTPEQIVKLLREVEAGQAQGKTVEEMCRHAGHRAIAATTAGRASTAA